MSLSPACADTLEVYLYSYNRGRYLRNCLESLRRHAPGCRVTVVDDGSEDPETQAVLEACRGQTRVVDRRDALGNSLGGLYPNMNWALEDARAPWVLFVQDDMQLVRDLTPFDAEYAARFFAAYPRAVELHTCFLKRANRARLGAELELAAEVPVYFRTGTGSNRVYFSAVGLLHAERLRAAGVRLLSTESANQEHLRGHFDRMGISAYPFMMWLPFAESVKFRRKSLSQRYAEWRARAGLYPFRDLTPGEVDALLQRDPQELPEAERMLELIGRPRRDEEWMYAVARHYWLSKKMLKLGKRLRGESARRRPAGS